MSIDSKFVKNSISLGKAVIRFPSMIDIDFLAKGLAQANDQFVHQNSFIESEQTTSYSLYQYYLLKDNFVRLDNRPISLGIAPLSSFPAISDLEKRCEEQGITR